MIKLNDIQLILLSAASQRDSGSLMPLPGTLAGVDDRARKAIITLLSKGLAEESRVTDQLASWRHDGDVFTGVRITDAGRTAIGVVEGSAGAGEVPAPAPIAAAKKKPAKTVLVLELLQRADGATLDEMVAATGWLPHTTRAALTGLRKKGHEIRKGKRGEVTCYNIVAKAA